MLQLQRIELFRWISEWCYRETIMVLDIIYLYYAAALLLRGGKFMWMYVPTYISHFSQNVNVKNKQTIIWNAYIIDRHIYEEDTRSTMDENQINETINNSIIPDSYWLSQGHNQIYTNAMRALQLSMLMDKCTTSFTKIS